MKIYTNKSEIKTPQNKIYNSKLWQIGIIIVIISILLSLSLPEIFITFEMIMGILLVLIGIIMIYEIFKPEKSYCNFKDI